MKRSLTEISIGDHVNPRTRYRLRIEDLPSGKGSMQSRVRLGTLFQTIADQPSLLNCGPATPEKITIHHDGNTWVVEAEAVEDGHAT
jgi:hypothetical protein